MYHKARNNIGCSCSINNDNSNNNSNDNNAHKQINIRRRQRNSPQRRRPASNGHCFETTAVSWPEKCDRGKGPNFVLVGKGTRVPKRGTGHDAWRHWKWLYERILSLRSIPVFCIKKQQFLFQTWAVQSLAGQKTRLTKFGKQILQFLKH